MNTIEKKIKYTANGTVHEFNVIDCYPYLEVPAQEKVVLVISAKDINATANDMEQLKFNETGVIEFYDRAITQEEGEEPVIGEWVLRETYTDYNSGLVYSSYQSESGIREARVTRVAGIVKELAQQRADIDFIAAMSDIPLE
jgi:hypothetical protein